ncbi:hypothetical protein [Streptomyces sp. NPDC055085]
MTDTYQRFRDRTSCELGLAGNHPQAIPKHLDAYEQAVANLIADRLEKARLCGDEDLAMQQLGTGRSQHDADSMFNAVVTFIRSGAWT